MSFDMINILTRRKSGCIKPGHAKAILLDKQLRELKLSERCEFVQDSHTAAVTSIAIDREDDQFLLTGLGDGTVCIHNIFGQRKKCGYTSKVELRVGRNSKYKHSHAINTVSWFTDNGMFLTSGRDGKLKIWDSNEGVVVEQFSVGSTINKHCVAHQDVGPIIAVTNDTNHLHLVDLKTGSTCHTLRGHEGEVLTCTWSRLNHKILASGSVDKKIMLWDVRQAKSFLAILDFNNVRFKRRSQLKLAGMSHQSSVHGLEFSRCGRYLVSLGNDNRLRKWDTSTGKNLKTKFPEIKIKHRQRKDGQWVDDKGVMVLATGQYLQRNIHIISYAAEPTRCKGSVDMACSEGGRTDILFVPESNNVAAFNMMTGSRLDSLVGHYSAVNSLVFSQNRISLYSGGRDRFVLQWDIPIANESSRASKVDVTASTPQDLNPYTADRWSSDDES